MANANVVASLAILVALGAALALARGGGERAEPTGGDRLDADVAIRVSAPAPARTLPGVALGLGGPPLHPELSRSTRRVWVAVERRGVDPRRRLLAPLSFLAVSLERSCPPPAVLACRPAIRLTGRLRDLPPPGFERDLRTALTAGLRATGFPGLTVHRSPATDSGRVRSRGETVARWRVADGDLEVVTGGLDLRPAEAGPTSPPEMSDDGGMPGVTIETNPATLAMLLQ
jgi:hypothetical protein